MGPCLQVENRERRMGVKSANGVNIDSVNQITLFVL